MLRRQGERRPGTSAAAAPGQRGPSAGARPARPAPGTVARRPAGGSRPLSRPGPAGAETSAYVYIDSYRCLWQAQGTSDIDAHLSPNLGGPMTSRVQLALNVNDIDQAVAF